MVGCGKKLQHPLTLTYLIQVDLVTFLIYFGSVGHQDQNQGDVIHMTGIQADQPQLTLKVPSEQVYSISNGFQVR